MSSPGRDADLRQMTSSTALASIPRFVALGDALASAGQPSEQELGAVAAAGFAVVINLGLSDPSYALEDEGETVRSLGMAYVHIPVQFSSPALADLEHFSKAMAAAEGRRVFVHCRHNKRVPVFVALDRVTRQGWEPEAAFQAMREVWVPDATWQAFIDEAVRRHAG